ncbi:ATP synthase F0 subunit B [Geobacter sp. DSM 9736]|uniref:ATP synthase F0 subunit B n=1 Tax=Geobacter sp. DSM 9736 TaxID=1277350 RepID=UPI000B502EE6|nr:ATP synthase F0 subunit B [Geobacter sp. DSM 9736]SNB47556.1 F-type H+-transporting ATPase subunit b [Geobacter sp. DSM 9736]
MINLDLTFVIQLINFLVLMLVLNIFLYKPLRKVLSEREKEISGARQRAAGVDSDVQEKVALYEARLREVKLQAHERRGAMLKEAQAEEAATLEKARKEASDTIGAIKGKVAQEAADAKNLLREQARSLSLEICEKVLGRSL